MSDTPEPNENTTARVSRRGFLGGALAAAGTAMLGSDPQANAADPRPQLAKPFKMQTVNKPWTDPANDTLEAILQDPIQYPGRAEIGFVPAPGNKVPTYVPGVPVPYNPVVAMNQSPTFQALDPATKKAVMELYAVRHGYALEHEQFRIAQHNALTGGQTAYPILYERVIGKPLKEDGTIDEKAKERFLGYVCKPAGNDTVDDKLPYFAFDERTFSMKGKLEGPANARDLTLDLVMKTDGLSFSYGHMSDSTVTFITKAGKSYALNVEGDDLHAFDAKRVQAATGVAPKKGDIIRIIIPDEVLRRPLKKMPLGKLDVQGDSKPVYVQNDPLHNEELVAQLQQAQQMHAGAPLSHGDRLLAAQDKAAIPGITG